ncbi:sporulation membrane protein YtaF [Aneurinibacillus sp. Ricciae_BoGa-3]|uniref:sporulation membrane protein YtaF n=1 Tax=Aneurinibacillus sp. Ricciae_BoGa-3 TaxID=3022697 RepID=UPI002341DBB8|nr:sporulation membrane protein YtaF [Aneurinibacillus sp. Ricciae_BoGa-3]WCK56876.1 sporulation membrane protein YtaF [Aneurinibacillus sp. Ricciae_BoGa-3]
MDVHSLLAIIAIGIASNLDNAGAGISYGVRKIRISTFANFIIALMGFILAMVGGLFGRWIALWITPFVGNVTGMIVLSIIGIWVLCQPFLETPVEQPQTSRGSFLRILRNPEEADLDRSKTISFGESIILGIALSVNNLAGGFDAGITHLNILVTSIISGVLSYLCVGVCAYLGSRFVADKLGKHASVVAGILLILVGLHQVL